MPYHAAERLYMYTLFSNNYGIHVITAYYIFCDYITGFQATAQECRKGANYELAKASMIQIILGV